MGEGAPEPSDTLANVGVARLQFTGHLQLESSFSQGSSCLTSLFLLLRDGARLILWLYFPFWD